MSDSLQATEPKISRATTRRYLFVFFTPLFITAVGLIVSLMVLNSRNAMAPVPLTGSTSFDEKMEFLRRHGLVPIDVLAVGSSMALNNLNTDGVKRHLVPASASYFNVGSFALKIGEECRFAEFLVPRVHPKAVIVVCGPMDFYRNELYATTIDLDELSRFLGGEWYALAVARHFDPNYYLDNASSMHHRRSTRSDYLSLDFDAAGGIPLDIQYPGVDTERWERRFHCDTIDADHYLKLAALAKFLQSRGITFIVVQPPVRQIALTDPAATKGLETHWGRIVAAIHPYGGEFFNIAKELNLPDTQFADYSHLNASGSRMFTETFMRRASQRINAALAAPPKP